MMTELRKNGYAIPKKNLTKESLTKIKADLTAIPRMNNYTKEQKTFPIYIESKHDIIVPKFYGIKHYGPPKKNLLYDGRDINIKFKGTLRDYQKKISDMIYKRFKTGGGGILTLPCGRGKTITAIEAITRIKKKTIVIVHKDFIARQWHKQLKQFTNASIGKIQRELVNTKGCDVVIAMLQSISMKDYKKEIFEEFGMVIVDECHHIGAEIYSRALPKINCRYTLGLSATPNRLDGMSKIFYWHLGNSIYKEELKKNECVQAKIYQYKSTDKLFKMVINWRTKNPITQIMITNLTLIEERNNLLIKLINERRQRGNYCKILVLSSRREHLTALKDVTDKCIEHEKNVLSSLITLKKIYKSKLKSNKQPSDKFTIILNNKEIVFNKKKHIFTNEELLTNIQQLDDLIEVYDKFACHETGYYWGKMKEASLQESEDKDIIFGTYDMASEALDIPSLNTIVLATPKPNVIQSVGRILRLENYEVAPEIIDIYDQLGLFHGNAKSRIKYYTNAKYKLYHYKINENLEPVSCKFIPQIEPKKRHYEKKIEFFSDSD